MKLSMRLSSGQSATVHTCQQQQQVPRSSRQRSTHIVTHAAFTEVADEISTKEVTDLLTTLTQPDMSIAELVLEMGDFRIKVRRNLEAEVPPVAAAAPAAASTTQVLAPPAPEWGAPAPHMDAALRLAPLPYQSVEDSIDDSLDEALLYVTANRVGVFRRGKSKCKVGDQVKKNQVLGAIEQLGTMVDVKSPQEGEIVAYKVSDGDPVEFGGAIVALAPYFNLEDAGKTQLRGIN